MFVCKETFGEPTNLARTFAEVLVSIGENSAKAPLHPVSLT